MPVAKPDRQWIQAGMDAAKKAGTILENANDNMRDTRRMEEHGRETKIWADEMLHQELTTTLALTHLPVYSEEGDTRSPQQDEWCWVIDPLDGSANFQRGFSLCASSIALCHGMHPIAGFIYDAHTRTVIAGGQTIEHEAQLQCANTATLNRAILCTGIPARLQWSQDNVQLFSNMFRSFYKIRMLGSAVQALLHVAMGKADVYFEQNIMFWDVAGAWAIAQAAGAQIISKPGTRAGSLAVLAATDALLPQAQTVLQIEPKPHVS